MSEFKILRPRNSGPRFGKTQEPMINVNKSTASMNASLAELLGFDFNGMTDNDVRQYLSEYGIVYAIETGFIDRIYIRKEKYVGGQWKLQYLSNKSLMFSGKALVDNGIAGSYVYKKTVQRGDDKWVLMGKFDVEIK